MRDQIKRCIICGREYHKINFRHIFHRMKTCGNKQCTKEHNKLRMREYIKLKPKTKKGREIKVCEVCEKAFSPNANHQKYCSLKCREFWYANKDTIRNVRLKRTTKCKVCDKIFIAGKFNSDTCSSYCSRKFYFIKNKKEITERDYENHRKRENKRRKKLGLPLIGEGYRSQNELLVYIKTLFPDLEIKTNDYKTLSGLQLDIYIPSLKLAFEYQGYQHFVYPNFYHKSQEEFEALCFRDKRKKELCEQKGIILVEVNHFEKLSLGLIIEKLNKLHIETPQRIFNEKEI